MEENIELLETRHSPSSPYRRQRHSPLYPSSDLDDDDAPLSDFDFADIYHGEDLERNPLTQRYTRRSWLDRIKNMAKRKRTLFITLVILLVAFISIAVAAGRGTSIPDQLTDKKLLKIAELSNPSRLKEYLNPLLIPRVSGTDNNRIVRDFIVNHFKSLQWDVQIDSFNDTTPILGDISFANVVATKSPNAARRLVFAAHYDSKYFPEPNEFVGATDSAVPCAILLDLAYTLNSLLDANAKDHTLQFIFFDGEEAVKEWGPDDSVYGSRNLAKKWASTFVTPADVPQGGATSLIQTIDLFVLLDLMGGANPKFPNLKNDTTAYYKTLQQIEAQLFANDLLFKSSDFSSDPPHDSKGGSIDSEKELTTYFTNETAPENAGIDDDHRPFEELGVPIVHLIGIPFPHQWHKMTDNADIIDYVVINNFNRIFRVFIAQYFSVSV